MDKEQTTVNCPTCGQEHSTTFPMLNVRYRCGNPACDRQFTLSYTAAGWAAMAVTGPEVRQQASGWQALFGGVQ